MPNNEWGDFQTPVDLSLQIVELLNGSQWGRLLEPTCGTGRFLEASRMLGPDVERQGLEIQTRHVKEAKAAGFQVQQANIFHMDLANELQWNHGGPLLIIGNPPWVTSAQLGVLGSINLPIKKNVRDLGGFDAMTGASNFDIAEFILLKLMTELEHERPTLAFLVKTQVARNILSYSEQFALPYSGFEIRPINAKRWFNASVDACLFITHHDNNPSYECKIYEDLASTRCVRQITVFGGRFVADATRYKSSEHVDGVSPVEWRSGIKHDAARVMEIRNDVCRDHKLETEFVYPLLKCSDLFQGRLEPRRCVIVPQQHLGQETSVLRHIAPRLWKYLEDNAAVLDNRKSGIYAGQPRFSVFGIGDYTFAPFKIAISGLHKEARFAFLAPFDGKPIVVDDTSYLLSFLDAQDAAMCHALLVSQVASDLLESLVFWDSKRPITKKLLQRIDLRKVAEHTRLEDLIPRARESLSVAGIPSERPWESVLSSLTSRWGDSLDNVQSHHAPTTSREPTPRGLKPAKSTR